MIIYTEQILVFFLIFMRFVGMFIMAPIFSRKEFFSTLKVILIFWFSGMVLFLVPLPELPVTEFSFWYITLLFYELLIGAMVGFTLDVFITAIEFSGHLMDTQAGLAIAPVLDPARGTQVTVITIILKWVAVMIFIIIDGHHLVLASLVKSFYILPIGTFPDIAEGAKYVVSLATYIFYLAVQIAAPITLVVFIVDFGFGVLNKVAEQVNVFQLGFQVKPVVALIIFVLILPGLLQSVLAALEQTSENIFQLFTVLQT